MDKDCVEISAFSQLASCFGPISDFSNFISRIQEMIYHSPWYHGSITHRQAAIRLAPYGWFLLFNSSLKGAGTFLVRQSFQNPDTFVIVYINEKSDIKQRRVRRMLMSTTRGPSREYFEINETDDMPNREIESGSSEDEMDDDTSVEGNYVESKGKAKRYITLKQILEEMRSELHRLAINHLTNNR